VFSFTPGQLHPQGKSPWYPLDRRLGGPQSRSGRDGELTTDSSEFNEICYANRKVYVTYVQVVLLEDCKLLHLFIESTVEHLYRMNKHFLPLLEALHPNLKYLF
jgi:hypothetical protein